MNVKQLLIATLAAALPFAAYAGGGDEQSKTWIDSLQSTRTVAEVRAEIDPTMIAGEHHPAESQQAAGTTRTRDEVQRELAEFGAVRVGA